MKMYVIQNETGGFYDNFEQQFSNRVNPSCLLPTSELADEIIDYYDLEGRPKHIWISETGKTSGEILSFEFIKD